MSKEKAVRKLLNKTEEQTAEHRGSRAGVGYDRQGAVSLQASIKDASPPPKGGGGVVK